MYMAIHMAHIEAYIRHIYYHVPLVTAAGASHALETHLKRTSQAPQADLKRT